MIRVAIVEERTLIREALANLLTSQGTCEVVGQTSTTDDVVDQVRENRADVLLVGSASDGGIAAARAIAACDSNVGGFEYFKLGPSGNITEDSTPGATPCA